MYIRSDLFYQGTLTPSDFSAVTACLISFSFETETPHVLPVVEYFTIESCQICKLTSCPPGFTASTLNNEYASA